MTTIEVGVVREVRTVFTIKADSLEAAEKIALDEAANELNDERVIEAYGTDDEYDVEWSGFIDGIEDD